MEHKREQGADRTWIVSGEHLFASLIPGLQQQADAYRVTTSEIDEEIIALFFNQLIEMTSALVVAVANRDINEVRICAHTLQGTGGTIGAPELSVVGVELSTAAKQGDFDRCSALLAALKQWISLQGLSVPD